MATFNVSTPEQLTRLQRTLERRNRECLQTGSARALSRTAARVKRGLPRRMRQVIDRPVPFTVNRSATFFIGADARDPIRNQQSVVAFQRIQSAYLNPIIVGETLTELYDQTPILEPVLTNLRRAAVRRELGVRITANGNVRNLAETLRRARANTEFVFEITRSGGRLPPGIYFRNKQRNGRGRGLFTLWVAKQRSERPAQFDFSGISHEIFVDNWEDIFSEELQRCYSRTR